MLSWGHGSATSHANDSRLLYPASAPPGTPLVAQLFFRGSYTVSQRSRRSFPNSVRFDRQPGAAVRQNRRRFRQHRARERRGINHVGHAHGASLRVHRVDRDVDRHPLGAVGYSLSVGGCY